MNMIKFAALTNYLGRMGGLELSIQEIETIQQQIEGMIEHNKASCEAIDALLSTMVVESKKIESIKNYRALTGADLKTSKDAVEKYWPSKPNDLRQGKPEYWGKFLNMDGERARVELTTSVYIHGHSYYCGDVINTGKVICINFDKGYLVTHDSVYRWE